MGLTPLTRILLPLLAEMKETSRTMSLADAATIASLSPGHLQRVFTAQLGESPAQYQQRLRLELGAIELRSSDARIIDIAFTTGFQSHEAFTRAFTSHFGINPKTYRQRSAPLDAEAQRWTAETGPCISLYRMPLAPAPHSLNSEPPNTKEYVMPSPEISRESIEKTHTLVCRRRVDLEQIAEVLAECLPTAFGYAMQAGLTMAGPPFVRYLEQSAAFAEIEAGVPLAESPDSVDAPDLFASTLPGGEAAVGIHLGPYDTLGDTHIAIDRWMAQNQLTASGGPWEVYLTDPGEVPDPNEWQTQIIWPLESQ